MPALGSWQESRRHRGGPGDRERASPGILKEGDLGTKAESRAHVLRLMKKRQKKKKETRDLKPRPNSDSATD